jgi:hypothetical protein
MNTWASDSRFVVPRGRVGEIVRQRSQAVVVTSDSMYFTERAKLQELMQTRG